MATISAETHFRKGMAALNARDAARAATHFEEAICAERLRGAIRYFDAQVDDARYTVTLARSAALHGAAVATSARVVNASNALACL